MSRVLAVLAVTCAAWLSAAGASAQADGGAQPSSDEAARIQFEAGVAAFDRGEHEAARVAFRRSYELRPIAAVLYNIGVTERALRHYAEAVRALERYLADDLMRTPEREQEVRAALAELAPNVVRLEIVVDQPHAQVRVDNLLIGESPIESRLVLAPGAHSIEVQRAGFLTERRALVLDAGVNERVSIELHPIVADGQPRTRARLRGATAVFPRAPRCRSDCRASRGVLASPAFWFIAGIVVAAGAGATTAAVLGRDEQRPSTVVTVHPPFAP